MRCIELRDCAMRRVSFELSVSSIEVGDTLLHGGGWLVGCVGGGSLAVVGLRSVHDVSYFENTFI